MIAKKLHRYVFTLIFIVTNRSLHNFLLSAIFEKKMGKIQNLLLHFLQLSILAFVVVVMIKKAKILRLLIVAQRLCLQIYNSI